MSEESADHTPSIDLPPATPTPVARTRNELRSLLKALECASQKKTEASPRLELGIPTIDETLGGGLETGRLHEIFGAAPAGTPGEGTSSKGSSSEGISSEDMSGDAAACGFAAHLLAAFSARGPVIWILPRRAVLHAPGLSGLGLNPRHLLVVEARAQVMRLWALAEALRSQTIAAVLAEIEPVDFNVSRRLQLAAAASGVTGLLLHEGRHAGDAARRATRPDRSSAARTRWSVGAAQSVPIREVAQAGGLGPPRWRLELRRGPAARRGAWLVEQSNEGLIHVPTADLEPATAAHARSVAAASRDRPRLARGG
jgi:protein ImuA